MIYMPCDKEIVIDGVTYIKKPKLAPRDITEECELKLVRWEDVWVIRLYHKRKHLGILYVKEHGTSSDANRKGIRANLSSNGDIISVTKEVF